MENCLNKDLLDTIYGFAGIYGVEIISTAPNYVTSEMKSNCQDEIWIMVEDNSAKENVAYKYKLKCLCCGATIETDYIDEYKVIVPIIKEKLIPYIEIRNYAKNLSDRYSSRVGQEITMDFIYDKIVENYCAA